MNREISPEGMLDELDSPEVVYMHLLQMVVGTERNCLIFCLEGNEDFSFYKLYFKNILNLPYQHVALWGKKSLIEAHNELLESQNELLDRVYFLVDQDYDAYCNHSGHIFNLDCYSIENIVCDKQVIEDILNDEFKLDLKNKPLKNILLSHFDSAYLSFRNQILPLVLYLYSKRLKGEEVEHPGIEDLIEEVCYDKVIFVQGYLGLECHTYDCEFLEVLQTLDDSQLIKGKYMLYFFQQWIEAIKKHFNAKYAQNPQNKLSKIKTHNSVFNINRFSQGCNENLRLKKFIEIINMKTILLPV